MKSKICYEDEEKNLSAKSAAFVQYLTRRGYLISQKALNDDAEKRRREMAKKAYHNTELLLESYRDMIWAVESIPDQIASELEMPFAELDELISRIDLELAMDNKVLQGRLYSISQSRLLIDRMNEAVSVLKKKPKDGPLLYDVIYKTYMSRSIPENIFDLLYNLHMSRRRYYELRKKAIRLISLRLWSAPNQEINMWLDVLTMLDKNPD
jgi:hypothetical protein